MKFILAKKLGMTTIYEKDRAQNVTLLGAEKNIVLAIRKQEKDGYRAVQVGLVKKNKTKDKKKEGFLIKKEFRIKKDDEFKLKQELNIGQFKKEDKVTVRAITKGKGFQGVVKRHGFAGSPASHGHRHDLRAPGSIGSAFPERVMKGKKMAGRMGGRRATIKNMEVVSVDEEKNILAIRGAVPGNNGGWVEIFKQG